MDREDRFWSKVDASGDCWEWTACRRNGYGRVGWDASIRQAHRVAYELLVGPIPPGLQLDHLCRNPGCVNPDHLEPVTMQENIRRGAPNNATFKEACVREHPLIEGNLYIRPGSGNRECRACRRAYQQKRAGGRVSRSGVV